VTNESDEGKAMTMSIFNFLAATNQGIFYPIQASEIARDLDPLAWFIHGVSIFFTVLIIALTVWFAFKYRASVHPVPRPPGHNNALEITWTAIPAVIVFVCFFWGFRVYMKMTVPVPGSEKIDVGAAMWYWQFGYKNPSGGSNVIIKDELWLPSGMPVELTLHSNDVIHSLYLPAMRVKKDAVPGRFNTMIVTATREGVYDLYCTEYCGDSHSTMRGKIYVVDPVAYRKKIAEEAVPDKEGMSWTEVGQKIATTNGCFSCHSIDGSTGTGPTWKDLYGKTGHTMADGSSVTVDDNYIIESIRQPNAKVVTGFGPPSAMNAYSPAQLSDKYIRYIIAYQKSISANAPKEEPRVVTPEDAAAK
jgi:cytochrome c oxidase subunit II